MSLLNIPSWLPVAVSTSAVIISLLSYLRNRPKLLELRLSEKTGKKYIPIAEGQIYFKFKTPEGSTNSIPLPKGILIHLSFLNPSPQDISYFSLGFYADDKLIESYTKKSVSHITNEPIFVYTEGANANSGDISFSENPYGIFKANSYTPFFAFMPLREGDRPFPKKVDFKICYSVKKFPYFGKNSHYKAIIIPLDISNVEKEIQEVQKTLQQKIKLKQEKSYSSPVHPYSQTSATRKRKVSKKTRRKNKKK
ncbi:hypothetical protein [Ligilactobacillus animalis]|uniref:hypothetical protein n=1 Tax=Ligilactobacillus animalis TaxID=1605 RepID=UPI0028FF87D2|nr:hypothetical protein [Ligilactobacillus animalis]MDU1488411.1 hypothetical protein [Ligilactobacillus animalis]